MCIRDRIAGGVDVVYPPENAALMERIVVEGAVVAERPLGAIALSLIHI